MALKFSDSLISGIHHVNGDVAYEIEYGTKNPRKRAEILAEVCLDGDRLEMWGHPEAQKELRALILEYGWPDVLAEAAKHVSEA